LIRGTPFQLGARTYWYLSCAVLAALSSAFTAFVWRPVIPRIIVALFSISMASQVLQHIVGVPKLYVKPVAFSRLLVNLALLLVVLSVRSAFRAATLPPAKGPQSRK
jgi:hypothetical protein